MRISHEAICQSLFIKGRARESANWSRVHLNHGQQRGHHDA
ncbi:hypothetical protein ACFWMT_31645 [Streptomyces sp. NPDC058368]